MTTGRQTNRPTNWLNDRLTEWEPTDLSTDLVTDRPTNDWLAGWLTDHLTYFLSDRLRECITSKPSIPFFVCLFIFSVNFRCENGHTVYLKEGYWANVTENGTLVTYYCPYKYCNCSHVGELPGCLFDPANTIAQCAKNREGWLCGKCSGNTSVGLR